ncbi:hypothetical protein [Mangrovibacterium lignilyticum]|uniref:hypothetical protein n=1 Tax=Mangrovibacterium lignilyticum TaxID=2668052 RepID=UPI0013D0601C|nr:hypothetical protein [Mangrovibacterium lignilyticum]
MKKRILLSFVFLLSAGQIIFAQTKEEQEVKERMWGDQFEGFQQTKAPEKWKDESAVILGRTFDYEVKALPVVPKLYEGTFFHERVLLQDKAAIEKYSEFNTGVILGKKGIFKYSKDKEIYIGIKIIKPDGKVEEVDTTEGVVKEMESDNKKAEYKSFAVPGIDVGDILDFYYVEKRIVPSGVIAKLETQYIPVASEYPVVIQRIALNHKKWCFLLAKSVNGAPELKFDRESEEGYRTYSLVDRDREKIDYDDYHWFFPRREIPMIKFEAYFSTARARKVFGSYGFFLTQNQEMKSTLKDEEILNLISWAKRVSKSQYSGLDKFISENYKKEKDINVFLEEAYYFARQESYRKGFENAYLNDLKQPNGIIDLAFAAKMSNFLDKKKISYDFIVTPKRWDTGLDDMLLYDELAFLLRINTPDPIYLTNFNRFSLYNEIDPGFQGNEAYKISFKNKSLIKLNKNIPVCPDNFSVSTTELNVRLSDSNLQQMVVNESTSMTGALRNKYISSFVTPYEYIDACKNDKYETPLLVDVYKSKGKIEELTKMRETKVNEDNTDRKTEVQELIKGELGLKNDFDIDSIRIVSLGMWSEASELKYSVDYRINEFVNKVGPNYLLEIGKLMGGQIDIDDKEVKQRKLDVYFPYARAYENEICFEIPNGYTVNGIENLVSDFSNGYCEFHSSAEMVSNKLIFKTRKAYKTNFMKAENWNDLLDMLNAATKISEQKVLLKKI